MGMYLKFLVFYLCRIMVLLDGWILMIACDWLVYGIRCMQFLNSCLQLWAVQGLNFLRLILLTSIAFNLLLVHLVNKFVNSLKRADNIR